MFECIIHVGLPATKIVFSFLFQLFQTSFLIIFSSFSCTWSLPMFDTDISLTVLCAHAENTLLLI